VVGGFSLSKALIILWMNADSEIQGSLDEAGAIYD